MGETRLGRVARRGTTRSFSILKRIVMGETGDCEKYNAATVAFQYPQADRDG